MSKLGQRLIASVDGQIVKMQKPFKGELHNWKKRPSALAEQEGIGYHILALPQGHPQFDDWIITSPVLYHNEETGEVETLNSRYKTIGPCKGTVSGKISKSDFA